MSTRSQIAFYENEKQDIKKPNVILYRHSDGMPERVLPDLLPPLQHFAKWRGLDDWEYCSARVLQDLCNQHSQRVKSYSETEESYNTYSLLGIGISDCFHSDIEYLYAIYPDKDCRNGIVKVCIPRFNEDGEITSLESIETIKIVSEQADNIIAENKQD